MMKVGNQHRSGFEINHTITARLYLFQRRSVEHRLLGRRGRRGRCLGRRAPLDLADERDAAILRVDGAVVSQQQVTSDEGASALETVEGTFFRVCFDGAMSASFLFGFVLDDPATVA